MFFPCHLFITNYADDDSVCVDLDNLLFQLRSQVTSKWYEFGCAVGIESKILDTFAEQCTPGDCIMEMLDYWLRNSKEKPTWRDVAKALKAIELPQLAFGIERVYTTGKHLVFTLECMHVSYMHRYC